MIRLLAISALALGLAGCVSPQRQARNDDKSCQGMGATPGTSIYVQCRMFKEQQRANEDAQRSRNLMEAAVLLNPPQPARVHMNCSSRRMGSFVDTTCY